MEWGPATPVVGRGLRKDPEKTTASRRWLGLKRSLVVHGYWVRNTSPEAQLLEVARRFHLAEGAHPFRRCVSCNGLLQDVPKHSVLHLPSRTRVEHHAFRQCVACGQVFWDGSHHGHLVRLVTLACAQPPDPEQGSC